MENWLTCTLDLLCQAALMEDAAASDFLKERPGDRQEINDWLLLALMWRRPEEAYKRYLVYSQSEGYEPGFISTQIKTLWEAQQIWDRDKEARKAYHVMMALLSGDDAEVVKYQQVQNYLCALDSLEAYLVLPEPESFPDLPLLVRLSKELPERFERELLRRKRSGWYRLFYPCRLLLLLHQQGHKDSAEIVRLIQGHRRARGELYHDAEVYAVVQALDFLAEIEPDLLPGLLPDMLQYRHTPSGDSRIRLIAQVLTILASEAVDSGELKRLALAGLQDRSKRRYLERWEKRIGAVVSNLPLTDERLPEFACRELKRLQRMLTRNLV